MTLKLSGTLVLVGCGKMGGAMLEGWLKAGLDPDSIAVFEPQPSPEIAKRLSEADVRLNPPVNAIADTQVLLVAIKPQIIDQVLPAFAPLMQARPLILSIAAGKTIAAFERIYCSGAAVIRTIPNTPAAIGRGITAMAANANVSPEQKRLASDLLSAIGEVVEVASEALIDAATAVSGSGPAYVFYLTECLAAAGEKAGLPADLAMRLARATVSGSGELMHTSGEAAATLRQNVTSPKGTTHAALEVLMANDGLAPLMEKAIAAAARRARELAG